MTGTAHPSASRAELLAAALLALLLGVAAIVPAPPATGESPPQALQNLQVARRPTLGKALVRQRQSPPLYPILLWAAKRVRIPPPAVNALLLAAGSLLLWSIVRRDCGARVSLAVTAAYGAGAFHAANAGHALSEPLVIVLELGVLALLLRLRHGAPPARLAAIAALVGASALTRYHALFWLLPGALILLWRFAPPGIRRVRAVLLTLAATALPTAAWLAKELWRTGYLTGMDRFSPRRQSELTGFATNVAFTAKTVAVDWLSPTRVASHEVVNAPWAPPAAEAALVALGVLALGASFLPSRGGPVAGRGAPGDAGSAAALLALLYVGSLVALWTVGNNDPIYTRFLYPVYPLLFVLVAQHDARLAASPGRGQGRAWLGIAAGAYVLAQLSRAALALARL